MKRRFTLLSIAILSFAGIAASISPPAAKADPLCFELIFPPLPPRVVCLPG